MELDRSADPPPAIWVATTKSTVNKWVSACDRSVYKWLPCSLRCASPQQQMLNVALCTFPCEFRCDPKSENDPDIHGKMRPLFLYQLGSVFDVLRTECCLVKPVSVRQPLTL